MSKGINLIAVFKEDGQIYDVLCLDIASGEARLYDSLGDRDFYVGLEAIELVSDIDIIGRVYAWNKERGLINKGYNKSREASFISEELNELLEGKKLSEDIDAYIDSIVFQIGALSKILKDPDKVKRCFEAVLDANDQKGKATDKEGKIIKDRTNFKEPNEIIEAILNEF